MKIVKFLPLLYMERLFSGRVLHQKVDDFIIDSSPDMQPALDILAHFQI